MNVHQLTSDEAAFLLFAIKRTLRDRSGLTPAMEQFYDAMYRSLSRKLERISDPASADHPPPERHRHAQIRPTWLDVSLGEVERDPPADTPEAGGD